MTDPSQYVRERHNDGRRDVRWPDAPEPLTVPVYDNHAHLEIADGDEPLSLEEQLDRAAAVGVMGVVQAGGDVDTTAAIVGGIVATPPPEWVAEREELPDWVSR